jgi:hypothetical protein
MNGSGPDKAMVALSKLFTGAQFTHAVLITELPLVHL